MMINGSWLVQELGGYQDVASADSFQLKCFSFPQWPGGRPEDQTAAYAIVSGLMVCRQGNATRHAIELVKYLSARDHPDMVHKAEKASADEFAARLKERTDAYLARGGEGGYE